MSLRVIACALFVLFFSVYAWRKSWFVSLCALIVFMAVNQHPDMPRSIGAVQGLNMWNILMLNILGAWWVQRRQEGVAGDMPRHVRNLLIVYFLIVFLSFLRFFINPDGWEGLTAGLVVSEYLINCVKWVLPGLLLFDACRTRTRLLVALASVLALYSLLAIQVIKHVPLSAALSSDFSGRAYKAIQNSIGYNRVTLSMMLGGASWAVLAALVLAERRLHKLAILGVAGIVAFGQALTGGRSGYISWGVVGLILCLVRWRRLLPVIPAAIMAIMFFLPGVTGRMFQGFGGTSGNIITHDDDYQITSGRTVAWPYVIKKIWDGPVIGFGREAMKTTGISQQIMYENQGESFPHPHNAYLEVLLDNGIIGFIGIIPFYLIALFHGFRLLLDRQVPIVCAVGGVACSLVLALLVGAMGGQTFYPREGSVGMWAAIGLMLRVSVERKRSRETGEPMFGEEEPSEATLEYPEEAPLPA